MVVFVWGDDDDDQQHQRDDDQKYEDQTNGPVSTHRRSTDGRVSLNRFADTTFRTQTIIGPEGTMECSLDRGCSGRQRHRCD